MPPVFLHNGRACITINYIMQWGQDGIWLYPATDWGEKLFANISVISQENSTSVMLPTPFLPVTGCGCLASSHPEEKTHLAQPRDPFPPDLAGAFPTRLPNLLLSTAGPAHPDSKGCGVLAAPMGRNSELESQNISDWVGPVRTIASSSQLVRAQSAWSWHVVLACLSMYDGPKMLDGELMIFLLVNS